MNNITLASFRIAIYSLTFIPLLVNTTFASQSNEPHTHKSRLLNDIPPAQRSAFSVNKQISSFHGDELHLNCSFEAHTVEHALLDSYKVSFSLNDPIKAIHTYLTPRLEFALKRINQFNPDEEDKITDLQAAFYRKDDSDSSQMFWSAYNQYQDDAFYHLKISPCVHPEDKDLPCVRPNYSQLFYEYKPHLKEIAAQLQQQYSSINAIKHAQQWVYTIPNREEEKAHFSPPVSVLKTNKADSDEKALLLATLVSQVAPQYKLYIIYPSSSVGSVSPIWLTIESASGMSGKQVTIDKQQYTVISGSDTKLESMIANKTNMTSESLY